MDRYTGITCNPLIHQGDTDIFDSVLAGAKTFYGAAKRYLNDNFDVQMSSFENSTIHRNLLMLRDYVLFGRCPQDWDLDNLTEENYESIHSVYALFKLVLEDYNYRDCEISTEGRYFASFILSAVSRFRFDAKWIGEFLPADIDDIDDDIYFTKYEVTALLGVSERYYDKLIGHRNNWLNNDKILHKLKDHRNQSYLQVTQTFKQRTPYKITDASGKTVTVTAKELTLEWLKNFEPPTTDIEFDHEQEVLLSKSVLNQCPELKGYLHYRSPAKRKVPLLYTHNNLTCLLNLLSLAGYYQPTSKP